MLNEDLLREAESNGTFDLAALEETLNEIRITSYNFLQQVQRDTVDHQRFDLKASDLRLMHTIDKHYRRYPKKHVAFLDGNFISERKRDLFKKSQFYNKELSIFQVSSRPDIFLNNYLVFVEGKFMDTVNLFCAEDKTYLIFDIKDTSNPTGVPEEYFKYMVENDVDITVFFIPNCAYGVYTTNRYVLEKYKDNLALSRFNIQNKLGNETDYITFINDNDLLFSSVITDTTNSSDMLRFSDNSLNSFNNKYAHLNIFGFRNLLDKIDVTNNIHAIEREDNPTVMPVGAGKSVAYSVDGIYKVVTHATTPFVTIYKKEDGVFTALPSLSEPPFSEPNDCAFSPDGKYLTIVHGTSTPLSIYKREGDTFIKLPRPQTLPTGTGRGVTFSHDSRYMAIAHVTAPFVTIYKIGDDTFTKLPDPTDIPPSTGYSVSFSPSDNFLAVAHAGSPAIMIYKRNGDTFTRVIGPDVTPNNNARDVEFSYDEKYLVLTHIGDPYVNIYKINGDKFTKLPDILDPPVGEPSRCKFSPNGRNLVVTHQYAPYVTIYERTNDTFTKIETSDIVLDGGATDCAFSPSGDELTIVYNGLTESMASYHIRKDTFFSIPIKDMPIPVENMMVFRNVDGRQEFSHDVTVERYYPNHYQLTNTKAEGSYSVYVFYFDDTETGGIQKYRNHFDVLYRYTNYDNTAFLLSKDANPVIRDYDPGNFKYDIPDFKTSSEYDDHLAYKINKLREWIQQDGNLLSTYLKYQYSKNPGYYIECEKIDLPSKYRENNFQEVRYEDEKVVFTEPHYVFILPNEYGKAFRYYRFFIDGLLYVSDITYADGRFEYFYIPTRLISSTSVIEIEKFDTYHYETPITFSDVDERQEITFKNSVTIDTNDIFMVNRSTNEFVDRSQYQISILSSGLEIDLEPGSFKKIPGNFQIRITDPTLIGEDLRLYIKEYFYFEKRSIETDEDIARSFSFSTVSHSDPDFIRMFKNGRLIPQDYIQVRVDNRFGGTSTISPKFKRELGDTFVADVTPYKYKTVYQSTTIPQTGFIDLYGKISRPFNLKWYDVYLNGRKLNRNHVDILSPTKIFIKNVSSLRNFAVIEKDRDDEYFGLWTLSDITDRLWEDFIKDPAFADHPVLSDTEPDLITEIIDIETEELADFFYSELQRIGFINPSWLQLSKSARDRYAFSRGKDVVLLNPSRNPATTVLKIFPEV